MIAFLQGKLSEAKDNRVVLDVNGVGYELAVSAQSLRKLPAPGQVVHLLTYQHVREDLIALYGFTTNDERDLFRTLIGLSGVGPKVAINILSQIAVKDFYWAIRQNDRLRLSRIQGLGKKTCERLFVELKEKATLATAGSKGREVLSPDPRHRDAARALIALGYKQNQAQDAVEKVIRKAGGKDAAVEDLVKEALQLVGKN